MKKEIKDKLSKSIEKAKANLSNVNPDNVYEEPEKLKDMKTLEEIIQKSANTFNWDRLDFIEIEAIAKEYARQKSKR